MGSIEMKILIKGAGDLATGIASRLYGAGHQIMMTDIAVPLTVRRLVAFSRAVYEGEAVVEDMTARLAKNQEEAEEIMEQGDIPVIVDPKAECVEWFEPDVIVDAILAKRNLGTKITDAPFVIGVGPGFTAGEDCNCVVETKRGHTLGNVIWDGSAIPNTGVPGNVGGYSIERLIKASADGVIEPKAVIGDLVRKGQIVAINSFAVRLISRSPMKTRRPSQSIFIFPFTSTGLPAGSSLRFAVLRMIALILAFTSRILNGFVI